MVIPITSEVQQQIVDTYSSTPSETLESLSDKFGIPAGWISRVLTHNDVILRAPIRVPIKEGDAFTSEYQNGETTIVALSEKYGWEFSCIARQIKKRLGPSSLRSHKRRPNSFGEPLVIEYLDNHVTHAELGEKYGLSRTCIGHRISVAHVSNPKYMDKTKPIHERAKAVRHHLPVTPMHLYYEIKNTHVTQRVLANKYHVSESCINHALARLRERTGLNPYSDESEL